MRDWARPPAPASPAAGGPAVDPRDISTCVVCGGTAVAKKCKIICQNCGYTRDCSDP